MADKKLCVGVIAGPHGVRGEVRVKSFTADPDALVGYGPFTDKAGQNEYAIEMTGRSKDMIRGRIRGIDDRDAAAALRGTKLYIDRDILPAANEGEFYYADLIGLPVFFSLLAAPGILLWLNGLRMSPIRFPEARELLNNHSDYET